MANPVYLPAPPVSGPQPGFRSDHGNVLATYVTTNTTPTQGGLPVTVPLNVPTTANSPVY